jgi:hypothetical protein
MRVIVAALTVGVGHVERVSKTGAAAPRPSKAVNEMKID